MEENKAALIFQYFRDLSEMQQKQFTALGPIYQAWNARINLISRQDIDKLYVRHVLYSLSIAQVIRFKPGTAIIDVGTGGGFPGIPLAILFPQAHFHLIDSVGKKIKVVQEIAQALNLTNVTTQTIRAEAVKAKFDFILGRAISQLDVFYAWVQHMLFSTSQHDLPNGILYLRGDHAFQLPLKYHAYAINQFFREPFFQTKQLIHLYAPTKAHGNA